MRWFILKLSVLKKIAENATNTRSVITSCITFSCISENGPPCRFEPMRLAGTWKQYSKSAMSQLIMIMPNMPHFGSILSAPNFRWPYQAIVMNAFDTTSSIMVRIPFPIFKKSVKQNVSQMCWITDKIRKKFPYICWL